MRSAWDTYQHLDNETMGDLLKCVWMLADVVAYKLCDREYDCEHCPFDRALRGNAPPQMRRARSGLDIPILDRKRR